MLPPKKVRLSHPERQSHHTAHRETATYKFRPRKTGNIQYFLVKTTVEMFDRAKD